MPRHNGGRWIASRDSDRQAAERRKASLQRYDGGSRQGIMRQRAAIRVLA
ncbi:hypothetical protein [Erwinia sp. B116]|nr:hypothetical protein [Erwinia sp. B116]